MRYQQQPGIEVRPCCQIVCCVRRLRSIGSASVALLLLSNLQLACRATDLDALVGFGQSTTSRSLYRPETATPLTVYLSGSGFKGNGQLQLTVRSNGRTSIYTRKVTLTEGPLKEARAEGFVFQLEPMDYGMGRGTNNTEITVQLLVDGREVAHKVVSLPLSTTSDSYNVLALTRNGSGLNLLRAKKLGLFHRHTNAETYVNSRGMTANPAPNGVNPSATLTVSYTRPDALPVMEQGYNMMDAVALADMPLDNLTDAQILALKGYVRNGGLLIVSGGGDLSRLKVPFYADMLPIEVSGSTAVTDLSALAKRYDIGLNLTAPAALVTGKLKPHASVLFQQSAIMPLVTSRAYGAGRVVLTSFDYLDPTFRGWKAAPALWRDLLRCGNDAISPRGVLAAAMNSYNGVDSLADALAGSRASNTPQFITVAVFLGTYIVLLIPVSYFVLKRMDKREMTWYTAPVLIASFTLISYFIALSIKGGSMNLNRVAVLESQAGSEQFAGYALMTLYSPRRSTYDINVGDAGSKQIGPLDVMPHEIMRGQSLGSDTMVEQNGSTVLRSVPIGLWDKRSFEMPILASLGGSIDASVHMTGDNNAIVTVSNHTSATVKDCAIVDSDRTAPIGDLAPGQTRNASIKIAFGAIASGIKVRVMPGPHQAPGSHDPKLESPDSIKAALRSAVAQAMDQGDQNNNPYAYGYGDLPSNFGSVPNMIVGWVDGAAFQPTVDGKLPFGQEVDLVCVHLPLPDNAPKAIAAGYNPFIAEPSINLDDEVGPAGVKGGAGRSFMRTNE